MNCKKLEKHIPDYLTGEIDDSVLQEFSEHIEHCHRCQNEVETLETIWADMEQFPERVPDKTMKEQFTGMLAAYKAGLGDTERPAKVLNFGLSQTVTGFLKAAAVVIFIVIGSTGVYQLYRLNEIKDTELATVKADYDKLNKMFMMSLLSQDSPIERLKGIKWASKLEHTDEDVVDAVFTMMESDSNMNLRLAAVDAMYNYAENKDVRQQLLYFLLEQTSPAIQVALIDLIIAIKEEKGITVFKEMLKKEDLEQDVKVRLEMGIKEIKS